MPNVSVTLPETSQTITRPIVSDIVAQVSKITKINNSDVFFPGDIGHMRTAGSSIDDKTERFPIFNTAHRTHVEVNEDYNEEDISTTAVTRNEHVPVFYDGNLKVVVTPIYVSSNVEITFKYNTPSKTEALRWRDDIRMRVSQMRDINVHDLSYQYLLPLEFLLLIRTIHTRREAVAGYGQTFEEYLLSYTTDNMTLVGDLIGDACRLTIAEKQTRVLGMYGFEAVPEKPERLDTGLWSINFTYKFTYDKPIACNMRYPIMIHNQLLPISYTNFVGKSKDLDDTDKSFRRSLKALNAFEVGSVLNARRDRKPVIHIPEIDSFKPDTVPVGTGTILYALSEVADDTLGLLDLHELGDIILDPYVIDYLEDAETPHLHLPYRSMMLVSLYRNNYLTYQDTIAVDSSLKVSATSPLDLRNLHRVRLGVSTDLKLLDHKAIDRVRRHPKALVSIIKSINSVFRNNVDLDKLSSKRRLSVSDFEVIYNLITSYGYANGNKGRLNEITNLAQSITPEHRKLIAQYRDSKIQHHKVLDTAIIVSRR